jgi:hypothetical protein
MRARSAAYTSFLNPETPHSYLCNGKMLWLHDGSLESNITLFQVRIEKN